MWENDVGNNRDKQRYLKDRGTIENIVARGY